MGYMGRYIAEENAEAYKEGHITYKELIRRLTLLTGSLAAGVALAVTMGCTSDDASAPTSAPTATSAPQPTNTTAPTLAPTATAAPSPTATRPPAPTTAPSTGAVSVSPNDPAIEAGAVSFKNADVTLLGYLARPKAAGQYPAVLVIHENRGMLDHFQDVARRFAKEGYVALALDLVSREGGTANVTDAARIQAALGNANTARLVEDMNGGVKYLQSLSYVRADRVGAMGFCFGGGMVWLLCARNPDIKAAAPFYGSGPPAGEVANIRAAVLGVYGGTDARINAGIPQLETALKDGGKTYKMNVYQGAGHAFFNDTGGAYNPTAAATAWKDTLDWFRQYLRS
ncbi:MAG: dienelactone hydrolase family protein [Chloroflexi bacterium]|nr:dienelactone hydrolase family protein [Chloroflexota bacterium]